MENKYTEETINEIHEYIKKNGYATNYLEPSFHLLSTLLLYFLVIYFIHKTNGYSGVLIILLAGLFARLFMIFHDCCHRSYFPTDEREKHYKGFNYQIATLIEQFSSYPAKQWDNTHSTHHKAHGNMNEFDGTRTVLTTEEYNKLDYRLQYLYNFLRFPPVFFLIMPIYVFWISHILHFGIGYIIKYSLWLFVLFKIGSWKLLLSFLIAEYLAGMIGVMIFHLQHQVNMGYWKPFEKDDKLSKANAELMGASVLKIPFFLEYFTNGIEYHNVHHLDPGVPSYKTKQIYYELVKRGLIPDEKIGYIQQFQSLGHTIFNEETGRYE